MKSTRKLGGYILFSMVAATCGAQTVMVTAPQPTPYSIVSAGPDWDVWQSTNYEVLPSGQIIPHIRSYQERATGLNFLDPATGKFEPSKEEIDVLPDGSAAAATNGQSQVFFPVDLATGTVRLISPAPESLVMDSAPMSISYSDGTNYTVIAGLTNSVGEIVGSNEVLYSSSMVGSGVKCDVLYVYRKSGLEQDIVFRTQPPAPERFGLNSANVKVQVTTVFLNPPTPSQTPEPANPQAGLADTTLSFGGGMKMIQGRAFLSGSSDNSQVPTFKTWVAIDATSSALVEQVPYSQISASLATLPLVASVNVPLPHGRGSAVAAVARTWQSRSSALPVRKGSSKWKRVVNQRLVATSPAVHKPGFCFDYITINSAETNYVFRGDEAYFVSSQYYLFGTTIIEGGTIVKMNRGGQLIIDPNGTVDCQTTPYSPGLFTSYNENDIGDWWGSGNPALGDVMTFLNFNSTNVVLHDLHFAYASNAVVQVTAGSSITLWDCEFVDVATAVNAQNVGLYNVLIGRGAVTNAAVIVDGAGIVGENVTADNGIAFIQATNSGTTVALTNCLITSQQLLTNSSVTLQTNAVVCELMLSGTVYAPTGGGSYYLTNGSQFVGTANIDPDLLGDLQEKTVWAPIVYANTNISSLGSLNQVARDTNSSPMIGFHYCPLDAVFGGCELTNALTISAGTAVGWFEENGPVNVSGQPYAMALGNRANLVFNGTATEPCYLAQYAMVQERGTNNWNSYTGSMAPLTFIGSSSSQVPLVTASFTEFIWDDSKEILNDNSAYGAGIFKDCEFYNLGMSSYGIQYLTFTNCLFVRPDLDFWGSTRALNFTNENCTYYNGKLGLSRLNGQHSFWSIENTIFDGTLIVYNDYYSGVAGYTFSEYNAYNTNNPSWQTYGFPYGNWTQTNIFENLDSSDLLVTNFGWVDGALGEFYVQDWSPVIGAGSTNANLLGLYHFTSVTNADPPMTEGTNKVNIGYAYVATDANANPLDSNGDGIPDYLEDPNGNGLVDNGETNWALAINQQPANETVIIGTNAALSVGADGVAPLNYQWYFNSNIVTWATSATLVLTNVQTTNDGEYFVVVTNAFGVMTSSVVSLTADYNVYAGPDETITNYSVNIQNTSLILQGVISAVGNNLPGPTDAVWSVVSAPMATTNTIYYPNLTNSPVTFSGAYSSVGTYDLRLSVTNNGHWAGSSDVLITNISWWDPVPYEDEGYRYEYAASDILPEFYTNNFDDSAWSSGQAGFGNFLGCFMPTNTTWPGHDNGFPYLYVRKHFSVAPGTTNLTLAFTVDNDAQIFLNGTLLTPQQTFNVIDGTVVASNIDQVIYSGNNGWTNVLYDNGTFLTNYFYHSLCCSNDDLILNGLATNIWHTGDNLLAVRVYDNGSVSYYDGRITLQWVTTNEGPAPVQIISPVNQYLLSGTNAMVMATNAAAGSGDPLSGVEFFDGGNPIGWATSSSNLYEIPWIPVTEGDHVLMAMAVDTNGLSSWSAPVTNYVRGLPTIAITNPIYGEVFQSPPTNIELFATAGAADDLGATVSNVIFFVGTNSISTNTAAPYTNFWTFTNAGTYTLSAEVLDSRGAVGVTSNIVITVEPTNRAPDVYAGPNQTNYWSTNWVQLNGRVADDGLPLGSVLSINWTNLSGGAARFSNSNVPVTGVSFVGPGTNVLQLSASDGQFTNYSEVAIVSLPSNEPPYVNAGSNQVIVLPAVSSNVFGTVTEVSINGAIPGATGIDYFPASNCVVASVYGNANGDPYNFVTIDSDGTVNQFSSLSNLMDEVYIAAVRDTLGGFKVGEMFAGNGVSGDIMRVEPDGSTVGNVAWTSTAVTPAITNYNAWLTLSNSAIGAEPGVLRGGLWVDRTGVWGGDLIVSAETGDTSTQLKTGDIWRVNSSGKATLVARIYNGDVFEGITTIPNNPQKYGPWAGCIVVGGDSPGDLFAINTNGFVVQYDFPFGAEDIRVIPQNENLYRCDQASDVFAISANQFSGMVGDILIADEGLHFDGNANLYRLHWDGQQFETYPVLSNPDGNAWEGINFAPAPMTNAPPISGWVQLNGVVINEGGAPVTNSWTLMSGPTNGEVEFQDPSLTNTIVNFTVPGTNILQLSASNGAFTVSSNVTIVVYQNQAPWVFAGTNEYTGTGQVNLLGLVTNIILPPPYNTDDLVWSVISEPVGGSATLGWTNEQTNGTYVIVTNTVNLTGTGQYVLALTADDGQATNSAYVTIDFLAPTNIIAPAFVITPTNEAAEVTIQLVNLTNGPITNSLISYNVDNYHSGSQTSFAGSLSSSNGLTTLAYANFVDAVTYDVITFSNNDWDLVVTTNHWAYPITCGEQWLGRPFTGDLSVEPWLDGEHFADFYVFNGNAGDTVHFGLVNKITGNGDNRPPLMMFLRNSNQVVAVSQKTQSDDGGQDVTEGGEVFGTALDYLIPATGRYFVEVTPSKPGNTSAMYDLYFSCGDETGANMQVLYNGTNVPSAGTVTFPTISVGTHTNIMLTITNSGDSSFEIVGVATNSTFVLTNKILGTMVLPNGSTNVWVNFNATTSGTTLGSLVLAASYPAGSNYIIYFMASTTPTDAPPSVQITSPANGSIVFMGNDNRIQFSAVAIPGSSPIKSANGAVELYTVTTNGLFDVGPMSYTDSTYFRWTNQIQLTDWEKTEDETNLAFTAVATDENNNTATAPPIDLYLYSYYSTDPNEEPQIQLLYNGTSIPSGGTVVFPETTPGTPVTVSLTVTNGGTYPLAIPGIESAGDFTVDNNMQWQAVPGNTSTNLFITFNASASGSSVGELVLTNNASSGEVYVVNLVGNAYAPGTGPASGIPPVATNEQFTVRANSANNIMYPLYLDQQFDTNALKITSIDTSETTGKAAIINNGTAISYTPAPGYRSPEVGGVWYPEDGLYYTVSDANGNTAEGTIDIIVYATDGPDVTLEVSPTSSPTPGELETLTAAITNTPSTNIVDVTFYLNNQVIGVVSNSIGGTTYVRSNWPAIYNPQYDNEFIIAAATDVFGEVGLSQQINLEVKVPTNSTPPVASLKQYMGLADTNGLQTLTTNVVIRDGVFNVYGQAYPPPGSNVCWQLSLYSSDGTTLIRNLTPMNNTPVGSSTTSNLLATCDLSTLQNGPYLLVLTVTSDYIETEADCSFFLDSNLKIGQFSFSQQDVAIPVAGIPLTVTRTYNSINPDKGDFGYGWTYSLANMNVSIDETRTMVPDINGDTFSEHSGGSYDVTLTLPNGNVTTFYYYLSGPDSQGNYKPEWQAAPGVTATLTLQDPDVELETELSGLSGQQLQPFWNLNPLTPWESFDFSGFVLTTVDGTKYYIDRQDLDDHEIDDGSPDGEDIQAYGDCYLSHIEERNGDQITITPGSVVFTATNGATKEIAITRNADNLIWSISDPNGQSGGPPTMVYQYDNQDNLIAVEQLVDSRGFGTYVTNSFTYTNAAFPHYITGIINANGTPVAENFYDASGKLTAVRDANGNLTQFSNNPTNNFEVVIDRMGNTNSYVYDSRGNVVLETNALGQITTSAYDINNNLTNEVKCLNGLPYSTNSSVYDLSLNVLLSSTDPQGGTTTYQYDTNADLLITTDARGNSTTNTYDGNGNLTFTVNALGETNQYIYQGDELMASIDPIGTMKTNTYDRFTENLIASATVGASGILSSNTYTYDDNGNRTSSTVWRHVNGFWEGDTTSNIYDAMNRVIEKINPDGGSTTNSYTASGQQRSITDANTNTTIYAYDDQNRLIATTNADGTVTSSSYDANDNRTNSTDQEGHVTQYQYDALNRLTNTIYPDNTTSATIYDALGRVAETIDARGTITADGYDTVGRQIAVTNAFGTSVQAVSSYTFDQNGNQITMTDADNHSTTNVYDALNRVKQVKYQDGTTSETVYDADGRSIAQTNQDKIATLFGYDGAGRLTTVTNALGQVTQYQYDEAGNDVAQIDALGRMNTFAYDGMGRRIAHTLPGLSAETGQQTEGWAYDLNGNQVMHTNFSSPYSIIFYAYDAINRLTNCYDSDDDFDYSYSYTLTGQRASMADSVQTSTVDYSYDSRGRLRQKAMYWYDGGNPISEALTYGYDANGNVASITSAYANGVHLGYSYDPLNRLTNVLSQGRSAAAYSYDLAGNLKGMEYGNGVTNQYQYDSLNRLTNLVWNYASSPRASFAYTLMNGGTRTNLAESFTNASAVNYQWGFDHLYRLTNELINPVNSSSGSVSYAYDGVGNRTNRTSTGSLASALPTDSYAYDTNDEIVATNNTPINNFDADNNMTSWGSGPLWTYDDLNRLIGVSSYSYVYDGDNNRYGRTGSSADIFYVVDDVNPSGYTQVLEEFQRDPVQSGNFALTRVYSYGLSLISQQQFNVTDLLPTVLSYYGYDGHGSVRFLMGTNGTITDTYMYDAFGNLVNSTGNTPNNYLYCAQQWDPDLGLYYNRARYNLTDVGRFTSMDTFAGDDQDPLSLHKYLYCENNPIDMVDPSGHQGDMVDLMCSMAIQSGLASIAMPVISQVFSEVGFNILPPWVTQAMKADVTFDAFEFGLSASLNIPVGKYPVGIAPGGGVELLVSPRTGGSALYSFESITANLGAGQTLAPGVQASAGFVFDTPGSDCYKGPFVTESIPYNYFPPYIKTKFDAFLASGFGAAWIGASGEALAEWKSMAGDISGVLNRGTANIFFDPTGGGSWGVSFSYACGPPETTSGVPSFSASLYQQLLPKHGKRVNFQ